jgi:hypothetical protein
MQEKMFSEEKEAEERRKRFMDHEREMRAAVLETMKDGSPVPPKVEEVPETSLDKKIAGLVNAVNNSANDTGSVEDERVESTKKVANQVDSASLKISASQVKKLV